MEPRNFNQDRGFLLTSPLGLLQFAVFYLNAF